MASTVVLLNPAAAGGRAAALAAPMRDWLAAHAPGVPLFEPDSVERARATLRCLPARTRVVLVGGDGTLHQMLPVLLTHRHRLAVVPVGSGNDLARALGLHGMRWPQALGLALSGLPRRIDTGLCVADGVAVPFVSSLAAGFDAAVARRAHAGPVWLRGQPRYAWATLRELAALRRWTVQLTLDGGAAHERTLLFASTLNTPTYGAGMPAVPAASLDDGRLDLLLAGRFGRLGVVRMLPLLMSGRHLGHAQVHSVGFETLRLRSLPALPLAADGEPLPEAERIEIRVRAASLSVVAAQPPDRNNPGPDDPRHRR
ncbi:MAG: diacylglycerol kinase family protein [Burkholderiaceae bacterium]